MEHNVKFKEKASALVLKKVKKYINGNIYAKIESLSLEASYYVLFTLLYHLDLQLIELTWSKIKKIVG